MVRFIKNSPCAYVHIRVTAEVYLIGKPVESKQNGLVIPLDFAIIIQQNTPGKYSRNNSGGCCSGISSSRKTNSTPAARRVQEESRPAAHRRCVHATRQPPSLYLVNHDIFRPLISGIVPFSLDSRINSRLTKRGSPRHQTILTKALRFSRTQDCTNQTRTI